jgi:uncharacterized protein YecE (DUF72 family)
VEGVSRFIPLPGWRREAEGDLDCEEALKTFLGVMDRLEGNLDPLLFQFPYFNRKKFPSLKPFFERLRGFLGKLQGYRFAVEVKTNPGWERSSSASLGTTVWFLPSGTTRGCTG